MHRRSRRSKHMGTVVDVDLSPIMSAYSGISLSLNMHRRSRCSKHLVDMNLSLNACRYESESDNIDLLWDKSESEYASKI